MTTTITIMTDGPVGILGDLLLKINDLDGYAVEDETIVYKGQAVNPKHSSVMFALEVPNEIS